MFRPLTRRLVTGLATLLLSAAPECAAAGTAPAAEPGPASEKIAELKSLAATGPKGAPALVAALKDSRAPVRAAAVELLPAVKGRAAVADIAPLVSDPEDSVAVRAVGALFALGGDGTLEPLRKALHSSSTRVRTETASIAGDVRDLRLVKDLGSLLSDDMPGVRRTALEALRALGDPSTFPFLMAATGDAKTTMVASAIAGLEDLKDARALPRVTQLAGSTSSEVRGAVAHAIPALGGLSTYAAIFTRLAQDSDPGVRRAAATGLRDAPSPEAGPFLLKLVVDPDPGVRRLAVQAARGQAGPAGTAVLTAALSDADENVRASAVTALGTRSAKDQAGRVAALATDSSERVRAAVASTLGDFGRAEDLPTLKRLAADPSATVRAAAVVAAARIGTSAAFPIVVSGAKDPDTAVRLETVRALGLLDLPEALTALRELASEGDLASRVAAIDQLGARKDRGAVALLRKIAQDPVETLRAAARRALQAIGA